MDMLVFINFVAFVNILFVIRFAAIIWRINSVSNCSSIVIKVILINLLCILLTIGILFFGLKILLIIISILL